MEHRTWAGGGKYSNVIKGCWRSDLTWWKWRWLWQMLKGRLALESGEPLDEKGENPSFSAFRVVLDRC